MGNQSDKALKFLVAMPLFVYWLFGSVNLFSGYLIQRFKNNKHPVINKQRTTLQGMSSFLFAYCIPSAVLLISIFFELVNRDTWLNVPQNIHELHSPIKAPMWPFITKAFMELLLGVLTSAWALGPRISGLWKSKSFHHKQPKQKYISSSGYSSASYQTVCPQNTLTLSTIKISRTTRKNPPSHASRKPRYHYKSGSNTPSHSLNLSGHETIF